MRKGHRTLFIVILILLYTSLLSGCSNNVTYHPGLVTMTVSGKLIYQAVESDESPFVIVRRYHRTWLESSEPLSRVTIAIAQPNRFGNYQIRFGADVHRMDLFYVLRGHTARAASFRRTLGIADFERDVVFEVDENWRENYFILLKPKLTDYLVEERYELKDYDQQFIVDWIDTTEKQLPQRAVITK